MDWKMLLQLLYMGLHATLWIWFLRLPFLGGTLPNPGDLLTVAGPSHSEQICGMPAFYTPTLVRQMLPRWRWRRSLCSGKWAHCHFCPLRSPAFLSVPACEKAQVSLENVGVWENKVRSARTGMQAGRASQENNQAVSGVTLYLIPFQMPEKLQVENKELLILFMQIYPLFSFPLSPHVCWTTGEYIRSLKKTKT